MREINKRLRSEMPLGDFLYFDHLVAKTPPSLTRNERDYLQRNIEMANQSAGIYLVANYAKVKDSFLERVLCEFPRKFPEKFR